MAVFRARRDVIGAQVGDDLVLLDPVSGEYFSLNATARFVWDAFQAASTAEDVTVSFAHAFLVDEGVARSDVAQVIQTLRDARLLVNDDETGMTG